MLRRMGVHYDRIDISKADSLSNGANIPAEELAGKLLEMLDLIQRQPTCVLKKVVDDPYLESSS